MASELNNRQQIFVAEYLSHGNGTKAAIAAGYAENSAEVAASRLLRNAKVAAEIDKKTEKRLQRLEITADRVLEEIAKMGFSNMLDYIGVKDGDAFVDLSELTREQAAAIQEITVEEYTEGRGEDKRDIKRTKFKLGDKRGSLELLGRHLKLFTDKVEFKDDSVAAKSDEELEYFVKHGKWPDKPK